MKLFKVSLVSLIGIFAIISLSLASSSTSGDIQSPDIQSGNSSGEAETTREPSASPGAATYTSNQNVSLSANGADIIRYTTDGSNPSCDLGTLYSSPILVSSSLTIKAIACYEEPYDGSFSHSNVASFTYTINRNTGGGGSSGGGGGNITYCTSVEYGAWQACNGSVQIRSVVSRTPSACILTTAQQLATSRTCIIDEEEEGDNESGEGSNTGEQEGGEEGSAGAGDGNQLRKEVLKRERERQTGTSSSLTNRLIGRILLQVEENGEAWYLEPQSEEKHYLGRPADAFAMMRKFGLGISEETYLRFQEEGVPSRFSGRILLRVEANGEAYYINPLDLEMHYLGRPSDAFKIMRELALGISNDNLRQIPLGLSELDLVRLIDIDLSLGMEMEEVRYLQRFLNSTIFPVALEGVGSKGNETNLFRALTEEALKKFQANYALTETGVFDQETRDFLAYNDF